MLTCSDNSIYTGITNNIDNRFAQHCEGINPKCYTFSRRPLKLIYVEEFMFYHQAIVREKQIKGWTRAKKQALANQDFELLKKLAKSKK